MLQSQDHKKSGRNKLQKTSFSVVERPVNTEFSLTADGDKVGNCIGPMDTGRVKAVRYAGEDVKVRLTDQ